MNIKSVLTTCFVICAVHVSAQTPLYKQSSAPVESRVKDLLGRMTVDEKIGQLCCPLGWEMYTKTSKGVVPSELYKERMSAAPIGSFWAVLRADPWTQKTLETGLNPQSGAKALNAYRNMPSTVLAWEFPFSLPKNVHTVIWPSVLPSFPLHWHKPAHGIKS